MFVSKEPVPVSLPEDSENIIYIKTKMDYGTKQRVQAAILRITAQDAGHAGETPMDMAAYQIALLVHNILKWDGPAFVDATGRAVPCTPANIEALDPDEPLLAAVLAEISRRNTRADDADPNALPPSANDGSTDSKALTSTEAPGTSTSPLPNATNGRPRKLTPVTPTS
jgi:hypothetical protein